MIGKEEIKLFTGDMIVYVENANESTKRFQELICNYSKVAGYKVNIQKSITFPYTSDEQVECEIQNTMPCTISIPQNEIHRYKSNQVCTQSL